MCMDRILIFGVHSARVLIKWIMYEAKWIMYARAHAALLGSRLARPERTAGLVAAAAAAAADCTAKDWPLHRAHVACAGGCRCVC